MNELVNQRLVWILLLLQCMGCFALKITYVKELPKFNKSENSVHQKGVYLKYVSSHADNVLHTDVSSHLDNLLARVNYELKTFIYSIPSFITHSNLDSCLENNEFERKLFLYLKKFSVPDSQAERANLFFIHHDLSCFYKSWMLKNDSVGTGSDIYRTYLTPIINNVIRNYPYFNRSNGANHVISMTFPAELLSAEHFKELLQILNRTSLLINIGLTGHRLLSYRRRYSKTAQNDIYIPPYYDWEHESPVRWFDGSRPFDIYYHEVSTNHSSIPFNLLKSRPGDTSFGYHSTRMENIKKNAPAQAYFTIFPLHNLHVYEAISKNSIPVFLSYEDIIKPFQRFLNWDLFSVTNVGVTTEAQRLQLLETLHIHVNEHRQSLKLRDFLSKQVANQGASAESNISKMLKHTVDASSWLHWHFPANSTKNIWGLLSLELWCNIKNFEFGQGNQETNKPNRTRRLQKTSAGEQIIRICNRTRKPLR